MILLIYFDLHPHKKDDPRNMIKLNYAQLSLGVTPDDVAHKNMARYLPHLGMLSFGHVRKLYYFFKRPSLSDESGPIQYSIYRFNDRMVESFPL